MGRMPARPRIVDEGSLRGARLLEQLRREVREAHLTAGVAQAQVARSLGRSRQWVSHFERGRVSQVGIRQAARLAAMVGLNLTLNLYPSGARLRDAGQLRPLNRFLAEVRAAWRIDLEVPVTDDRRDQRAFDAVLRRPGQIVAVEAYSRLVDFQAQARVARLKLAASGIERFVIVLNATRANRQALIQAGPVLRDAFPLGSRPTLHALRRGQNLAGDGVVLI